MYVPCVSISREKSAQREAAHAHFACAPHRLLCTFNHAVILA